MRDFFKQCLEDLQPLTGNRQLFFLMSDADGKRKVEVLLDGLVSVSQKYSYIPHQSQKSIIKKMMIEDNSEWELNARTVSRWFEIHKVPYLSEGKALTEEDLTPQKELSQETKKMINEYLIELAHGFKKVPGVSQAEMDRVLYDDEHRMERKASSYIPNPELVLIHEKRDKAIRARGLDKLNIGQLKAFKIEGKVIMARNKDEANEMYLEIYM